jgi:hypothetical protein
MAKYTQYATLKNTRQPNIQYSALKSAGTKVRFSFSPRTRSLFIFLRRRRKKQLKDSIYFQHFIIKT